MATDDLDVGLSLQGTPQKVSSTAPRVEAPPATPPMKPRGDPLSLQPLSHPTPSTQHSQHSTPQATSASLPGSATPASNTPPALRGVESMQVPRPADARQLVPLKEEPVEETPPPEGGPGGARTAEAAEAPPSGDAVAGEEWPWAPGTVLNIDQDVWKSLVHAKAQPACAGEEPGGAMTC